MYFLFAARDEQWVKRLGQLISLDTHTRNDCPSAADLKRVHRRGCDTRPAFAPTQIYTTCTTGGLGMKKSINISGWRLCAVWKMLHDCGPEIRCGWPSGDILVPNLWPAATGHSQKASRRLHFEWRSPASFLYPVRFHSCVWHSPTRRTRKEVNLELFAGENCFCRAHPHSEMAFPHIKRKKEIVWRILYTEREGKRGQKHVLMATITLVAIRIMVFPSGVRELLSLSVQNVN